MVDSHAHLQSFKDVSSVLERAAVAGIELIIVPGDTLTSSKEAIELAARYPEVRAAVGVHPHEAKRLNADALKELERQASSNGVVAIGEIGLDYHYDHSPREIQRRAFAEQLALASRLGLPAIIHNREADRDVIEIVEASSNTSGVFHCFSGDIDLARKVLELGYYISIAGPVTFRKATTLVEVAKFVPGDRLLVETDSPYLAPEPFRGRRNEPARVSLILARVAEIRGEKTEEVAASVRENARKLFGV